MEEERKKEQYVQRMKDDTENDPEVAMWLIGRADRVESEVRDRGHELVGYLEDFGVKVKAFFDEDNERNEIPDSVSISEN